MKEIPLKTIQNIFGYGAKEAKISENTYNNEKLGISFTEERILITYVDSHPDLSISLGDFLTLCKTTVTAATPWTLQSYTNHNGSGICRIKVGDGQELAKMISPEGEFAAVVMATSWAFQNKRGAAA